MILKFIGMSLNAKCKFQFELRLAGFIFLFMVSSCGQLNISEDRRELTLPLNEVLGAAPSSFNLRYKGTRTEITAIGQIFQAPIGFNYLFNIKFLCRQQRNLDLSSDISVKLRLSEWTGDRPASKTIWESEPLQVKSDFTHGWITFDMPHAKLKPNQEYIAWLSMSGLKNDDDAVLGIVSMGPQTREKPKQLVSGVVSNIDSKVDNFAEEQMEWIYSYPEGLRAFWRHGNPDGIADYMTQYSWKIDDVGHNLHFKMQFSNTKL